MYTNALLPFLKNEIVLELKYSEIQRKKVLKIYFFSLHLK